MSLEQAIGFVLSYEGGYVNNPQDPGGETKFGISKKQYPSLDIQNLSIDDAKMIYQRDYWEPSHCDELPEDLAMAVFDCAVNQGVGTACRLLQTALDVSVDGILGPMTITTAHKTPNALTLFLLERARLYMRTNGVQTWGANWGARLIELAQTIFKQTAS